MPRAPSIKLRLARVLNAALERIEDDLNRNPEKRLSEAESRMLKTMAQADAVLQGRKELDGEEEAPTGSAKPADAASLVARMREHMKSPAAPSADGEDEAEP